MSDHALLDMSGAAHVPPPESEFPTIAANAVINDLAASRRSSVAESLPAAGAPSALLVSRANSVSKSVINEPKTDFLERELRDQRIAIIDLERRLRMYSPSRGGPVNSMGSYTHSSSPTISFQDIKGIINTNYNYQESIESTTLDIIAVYLRGQKILYTEAKVYCEQHLYALMLPAILITAVCSVISVVLRDYTFGAIIVSSFTATNSFILSLVTYLKLDAKAEAHKTAAYSFETLQSICEFSSGKVLLSNVPSRRREGPVTTMELIEDIHDKVREIKEKNQFILPEYIRYSFPLLCGTNVFAEVKRIQNHEIILINGLKNIINDKMAIEEKIRDAESERRREEMECLLETKKEKEREALGQIIAYRNEYIEIDKNFRAEIDAYIGRARHRWFNCCVWLKT